MFTPAFARSPHPSASGAASQDNSEESKDSTSAAMTAQTVQKTPSGAAQVSSGEFKGFNWVILSPG